MILAYFYAENCFTVKKSTKKLLQAELLFLAQISNGSAAGASPHTPLGELTTLLRPPSCI